MNRRLNKNGNTRLVREGSELRERDCHSCGGPKRLPAFSPSMIVLSRPSTARQMLTMQSLADVARARCWAITPGEWRFTRVAFGSSLWAGSLSGLLTVIIGCAFAWVALHEGPLQRGRVYP